jgi:uncharacterized protein YlzI (FlbEa/FlbD family)
MTTVTTSIGTSIVVKETVDEITEKLKYKSICVFTLANGESVGINVKHIVNFK